MLLNWSLFLNIFDNSRSQNIDKFLNSIQLFLLNCLYFAVWLYSPMLMFSILQNCADDNMIEKKLPFIYMLTWFLIKILPIERHISGDDIFGELELKKKGFILHSYSFHRNWDISSGLLKTPRKLSLQIIIFSRESKNGTTGILFLFLNIIIDKFDGIVNPFNFPLRMSV